MSMNSLGNDMAAWQRQRDAEHLRILVVLHYVYGGMVVLVSSVFLFHFFIGLSVLTHSSGSAFGREPAPESVGWVFLIAGAVMVLLG